MGLRASKREDASDGFNIPWPDYNDDDTCSFRNEGADSSEDALMPSSGQLGMVQRREDMASAIANASGSGSATSDIPITIVAGALGAGKTTLMERIVGRIQGLKLGVIVNDYASLNVDYIKVKDSVKAVPHPQMFSSCPMDAFAARFRADLRSRYGHPQ